MHFNISKAWLIANVHKEDGVAIEAGTPTNTMSEETTPNPAVVKEIADIKTARVEIDQIIQKLRAMTVTQERKAAIVKLQEGIMWLGMDLKRIKEQSGVGANPYPESYNPASSRIDPTADNLKM